MGRPRPAAMLRVAKLTDYATVVMTVLAAHQGAASDTVLSAPELAERAGLETPTVAKVLKPLAQAGLVAATRGANGGYRLARAAEAIGLIDIVEALEGPLGMTECSVHTGNCGIEQSCGVRANWNRINDVVIDALRGVTLAQMLAPPPAKPASTGNPGKRIDLRLATTLGGS